ncbi:MAG: hypothetical protein OJF49_001694 [Ktedonobacterales bacterium]|jgi:hypothetical protein|nr:MAG: hypothetical protein OJF49_001694 [Ktedonobacterales bacterium]
MSDLGGSIRFLTDENFRAAIVRGLRRRQPGMDILTTPEAHNLGMHDPQVLVFAAEHDRILLSHDVNTMIADFDAFLASGQHSPGLFLVAQEAPIGPTIEDLLLIWEASNPDKWRDRRIFLPL